MSDADDDRPTLRFNVTISPLDHKALKQAALDVGTPAAVLARTLIQHGLAHIDDDAKLRASVEEAAAAERIRRREAARAGGRKGGGSNKKE